MHPLIYIGGALAAWWYFKNKSVQVALVEQPNLNPGVVPPGIVSVPVSSGVVTGATVINPNPQMVLAAASPAGTLLGYGGGGFPFFSDGRGGLYGGPDGKTPVTAPKTLLFHGRQYVWVPRADGTFMVDPTGVPTWTPTASSPGMDGLRYRR